MVRPLKECGFQKNTVRAAQCGIKARASNVFEVVNREQGNKLAFIALIVGGNWKTRPESVGAARKLI